LQSEPTSTPHLTKRPSGFLPLSFTACTTPEKTETIPRLPRAQAEPGIMVDGPGGDGIPPFLPDTTPPLHHDET
jgi:hypothetical protein